MWAGLCAEMQKPAEERSQHRCALRVLVDICLMFLLTSISETDCTCTDPRVCSHWTDSHPLPYAQAGTLGPGLILLLGEHGPADPWLCRSGHVCACRHGCCVRAAGERAGWLLLRIASHCLVLCSGGIMCYCPSATLCLRSMPPSLHALYPPRDCVAALRSHVCFSPVVAVATVPAPRATGLERYSHRLACGLHCSCHGAHCTRALIALRGLASLLPPTCAYVVQPA